MLTTGRIRRPAPGKTANASYFISSLFISNGNQAHLTDVEEPSTRITTLSARSPAWTPWYINVGRARVRSSDKKTWAFPHTGKPSYHVPERFAKLVIE